MRLKGGHELNLHTVDATYARRHVVAYGWPCSVV